MSGTAEEPQAWSRVLLERLYSGWMWFDRWAGWLIGLDNSPYQWAVAEHKLIKAEEEREHEKRAREENQVQHSMEAGAAPSQAVIAEAAGTAAKP